MTGADLSLIKVLADFGGSVVLTGLLLYFAYKLLDRYMPPFITSQQQIATEMGNQAQSMRDMQGTVNTYVCREDNDHREILLTLQVLAENIKHLTREVRDRKNDEE